MRGHGGSSAPDGPYTIAELAGDVLELLDSLGIDQFHYAGVSIGGAIGQWLAIHHGWRLASLAVCASAPRFADPESWPARAATVRAEGTEPIVASRLGTWYTQDFAHTYPQETQRLLSMLRATSREGYAGCCEAIGTFDVRGQLGEIRVPTLALAGAEDPATPPEMLRQITDAVPGAELVVVPNAAHLLGVEQPETVNQALAAHLAATSSRTESGHG